MRGESAGRGREGGRGRRAESGRSSGARPRETEPRPGSSAEVTRLKEVLLSMSADEKHGASKRDDGAESGRRRRMEKREVLKGEGAEDVSRELRWRMNRLENEKLQLTSAHNQQVCSLEAELARLRSAVERGEAERAKLQFQLAVRLREKEKEVAANRDLQRARDTLHERQAELEQSLSDLRAALDRTLRGREQDQESLRRELEQRDALVQRLNEDNRKLHSLLTDQKQALEQSEQRVKELQRDVEKEQEVKRRHADELRYLSNREKRLRADKEFAEQKMKTLETNMEAERAAHLESKFNSEIVQLRLRDLEAALAVERSSLQEATCSAEQLKEHVQEAEKKSEQEQQRSSQALAQLHRLQLELEQCKSDLGAALETEKRTSSDLSVALETEKRATSCLKKQLEDERTRGESTASQLQQATENVSATRDAFNKFARDVKETLQQHLAEHSGSWSPEETVEKLKMTLCSQKQRQEEANKQSEDLLFASEQLLDQNQALKSLSAHQKVQMEETDQLLGELKQEVTRLQTEGCDWSNLSRQLQVELQRERDERRRERDRTEEQLCAAKQQQLHEEQARVTSLHDLLQRLQPQSIMGTLCWDELWVRVCQRVDQTNADLHQAEHQVSSLQSVLSRLEDKVRRREAELGRKHQHAVTELQRHLQSSRSECRSLQDHVTSLTSDLSSLCDESGRFQWACLLLGGALAHAQTRLRRLSEQKAFLCGALSERDALEQEVRALVEALEADEGDAEQLQRRKSARRAWRRAFHAVTALRKWRVLGKLSRVSVRLQLGGACAVGVSLCGDGTTRKEGQTETGGREACLAQWLRSKHLSTVVLSSMSDLQGALSGSSPHTVLAAVQSGLTSLLSHLLDQSDAATTLTSEQNRPIRRPAMQPHMKELVSRLQQHFLDFSQRLHATEVERRSLRLELNNLRRAAKKREQEADKMVPSEQFDAVCSELREALCREQEAQSLVHELNTQLNQLRDNAESLNARTTEAQAARDQTAQLLSDARREVCRKERSLRILGKHLSAVQKEKRQLEARLREAQDEIQNATKRKEQLMEMMRKAERSCTQFRESLAQSHRRLCSKPRPLAFPESQSGAEGTVGDPGVVACQSLLSSVALLSQTLSSRADWLEQEVSAHQSHVTALRSELQDACLRHNQAFAPVAVSFIDVEPVPVGDLLKGVSVI